MTAMSDATPQRAVLTVAVDIDPTWHGHDLAAYEVEATIRRAINKARGLQVAEACSVVTR